MLSALISSVGRQPAVPLAGQLAHESYVRFGPLVLEAAPHKSPTPTEDRDRHVCYRRRLHMRSRWARSFLPGSACRHAGRTISSPSIGIGVFGIWSLRILDASLVHSPVPAPSVHGECQCDECFEALGSEVLASRHRSHDVRKGLEISLLRADDRLRFEEWDDPRQQVLPFPNHEHQGGVRRGSMVLLDPSAAEALSDEVEDLTPFSVLTHVELRHQLPTGTGAFVPTDRDVKRTFSVDETGDVCVQPFLLIVRTGWIFTAHACTLRRG